MDEKDQKTTEQESSETESDVSVEAGQDNDTTDDLNASEIGNGSASGNPVEPLAETLAENSQVL